MSEGGNWYIVKGVGNMLILDCLLMENALANDADCYQSMDVMPVFYYVKI
jgi:hypothetical protein